MWYQAVMSVCFGAYYLHYYFICCIAIYCTLLFLFFISLHGFDFDLQCTSPNFYIFYTLFLSLFCPEDSVIFFLFVLYTVYNKK